MTQTQIQEQEETESRLESKRAYIAIHRDIYRKLLELLHEIESKKGRRVSFGELIDFLIDFYHEHKNERKQNE